MSDTDDEAPTPPHAAAPRRKRVRWVAAMFVGICALAALILFSVHVGDITGFARQAANAKAGPLFAALIAHGSSYVLAALAWHLFLHRVGAPLKFTPLIPMTFAKLFADQALPSAGMSGAAYFLFALTRRGAPDKIAFRTFAFATTAYFLAFLISAVISLIALARADNAPPGLSASVSLFAGLFLVLTVIVALFVLYKPKETPSFILRRKFTAKAAEFIGAAFHDIRAMPALFAATACVLLLVRAVDGLTLMLISEAIDVPIALSTGFIAVAIASIAATIGPVPMGLGTFEAGMVASLTVFGVSLTDALTATMIYRGLTLWLPLLPGFVIIQREFLHRPKTAAAPETSPKRP